MLFYVFPQQAQIHFSICVAVQDKLPRVSTLRRVMRNFYGDHPGESCHIFRLTGRGLPAEDAHAPAGIRAPHGVPSPQEVVAADQSEQRDWSARLKNGRGERIRTSDPLVPNQI